MRMRAVIAAAVSLVSVGLFAATLGSASLQGAMFVEYQPAGLCASRITSVSDDLKAQGLRPGDVVQRNRMNAESRLRLSFPSRAGSQTTWPIDRAGKQISLNLNFSPVPSMLAWNIVRLSFVVLGLIALWRGRDAASLALGVFFCGISAILSPNYSLLNTNATFVAIAAIALLGATSLVGLVWLASALTAEYLPPLWIRIARTASPIIALVHLAG